MSRSATLRRPAEPAFFRRVASAILRALHLRQTRQHLAGLEPHMLRDIGLTPDQARTEAARPLWDAPQGWRQRDQGHIDVTFRAIWHEILELDRSNADINPKRPDATRLVRQRRLEWLTFRLEPMARLPALPLMQACAPT